MTGAEIKRLCPFIPPDEDNILRDHYNRGESYSNRDLGLDDPILAQFLCAYKDMSFGWNFARIMAINGLDLPSAATCQNDYLWRAYLYFKNPHKYRDPVILDALSLMTPANSMHKTVVNALMVNDTETVQLISERLHLPLKVVEAYQSLFYDIAGRRNDLLFISSLVYPRSRLVEFFQHYLENESLEMILLRAGYNNGAEDVLYLAGVKNVLLEKTAGREAATRLEALMMSNGYILARNGWLNTNGPALANARILMAAAKQGGQDTNASPLTHDRGLQMRNDLISVKRGDMARQIQRQRDMEEGVNTAALVQLAGV